MLVEADALPSIESDNLQEDDTEKMQRGKMRQEVDDVDEEDILEEFTHKSLEILNEDAHKKVESGGKIGLNADVPGKDVNAGHQASQIQLRFLKFQSLFMTGISKISVFVSNARPWSEFFEFREYSLPVSSSHNSSSTNVDGGVTVGGSLARSYKNFKLYSINYAILTTFVTMTYVFFNPYALIMLCIVMFMWAYVFILREGAETNTMMLMGRKLSRWELTLATSTASVVIIFFMSNTGHLLLGAVGVGIILCFFHSILRTPPELFLDDGDENLNDRVLFKNSPMDGITSASTSVAFQHAFSRLWNSSSNDASNSHSNANLKEVL